MYKIFYINSLAKEKEIVKSSQAYKNWFGKNKIMTNFPQQDIEQEYGQRAYEDFKNKIKAEWKK